MKELNSIFKINLPSARIERLKLIKDLFPDHGGPHLNDAWSGGRAEALSRLAKIKPIIYSKNRNFLDGDVTRLSPYIRHGCISIAEAIQATKEKAKEGAEKLLFEFAWRDYWRKVWYLNGHAIESDMESPKVELKRSVLPQDVKDASTGLVCIDHFVKTLDQTGYLHNHARMWLASYMIHWRGADWKLSADWMFKMLLDGDRASNNLSWQWVASTFGSKPYFFNKENLSKYSQNKFCQNCKAQCPFDHSYEALSEQLFKPTTAPVKIYKKTELPKYQVKLGSDTVILFHDEMLSSTNSLYDSQHKKIFIFDPVIQHGWTVKRLQFIADCLVEMPGVEIWVGDIAEILNALNTKNIITQNTPNLMFKSLLCDYDVVYIPESEPYSEALAKKITSNDLRRFSKYWNVVGSEILKSSD
ncbi:MAG: hypothetical protein RLZZ151_963 [Pseudomonadota bacterium]